MLSAHAYWMIRSSFISVLRKQVRVISMELLNCYTFCADSSRILFSRGIHSFGSRGVIKTRPHSTTVKLHFVFTLTHSPFVKACIAKQHWDSNCWHPDRLNDGGLWFKVKVKGILSILVAFSFQCTRLPLLETSKPKQCVFQAIHDISFQSGPSNDRACSLATFTMSF